MISSSSMTHMARILIATAAVVVVAIAGGSSAAIATTTGASPLVTSGLVHYQTESMKAFEAQLADHEIHAAAFNYVANHLHLQLNDGHFMLVAYPPAQTNHLVAEIKAKGIPIVVTKKVAKPVHHVLRYVVGGIVIVVIVIILFVLLIGRRRALSEQEAVSDEGRGQSTPPPPGVT